MTNEHRDMTIKGTFVNQSAIWLTLHTNDVNRVT